jgi:hypothetical protein
MYSIHLILLFFTLSFHIPRCICLGNWTWMYGEKSRNSNGVYGEIGVPNPSNIPSARYSATASFDESSGTLWLFGGGQNAIGRN